MDVIIIGGGASGLALAVELKILCPKHKVAILEHLDTLGKKILATGNGRCNLSNVSADHSDEVVAFFDSIGLKTKADSAGRIYPYCLKASAVQSLLIEKAKELGVKIITDVSVLSAEKSEDKFFVKCQGGDVIQCDILAVCTGGKAQPRLGSDGSGYSLLRSFGHTMTPVYPSLVQLKSSSKYPRKISGTRTRCNLTIELDGESVQSESGELLFTDYGLSGIVAMNLSHIVAENFEKYTPKKCVAVVDLVPDMTKEEVEKHITDFGSLKGILGLELDGIISAQGMNDPLKMASISKGWRLILTGTKGYDYAQITGGGIKSSEFDTGFMSKKTEGLFACGEVLDTDLPCGGFNLNHAFYSGIKGAARISGIDK